MPSIADGIARAIAAGRDAARVQERRASAARFDWDATARQMLALYEQVAATPRER
ncbi:MAG: hypothetical protein U1E76_03330 [Planctomycetota bacterium]